LFFDKKKVGITESFRAEQKQHSLPPQEKEQYLFFPLTRHTTEMTAPYNRSQGYRAKLPRPYLARGENGTYIF
jgi:hypothetical protein